MPHHPVRNSALAAPKPSHTEKKARPRAIRRQRGPGSVEWTNTVPRRSPVARLASDHFPFADKIGPISVCPRQAPRPTSNAPSAPTIEPSRRRACFSDPLNVLGGIATADRQLRQQARFWWADDSDIAAITFERRSTCLVRAEFPT